MAETEKGAEESAEKVLLKLQKQRKVRQIKKGISVTLVLIILGIIIFLVFAYLSYRYWQSPEIQLQLGAEIEQVSFSRNMETAYIKLRAGSNLYNITKVKFNFLDNQDRTYNYDTTEGITEIQVPYEKTIWEIIIGIFGFKPRYPGVYNYNVSSGSLGVNDFYNIIEISASFEYINGTGMPVNTTTLDTTRQTNQTRRPSGPSGPSDGNPPAVCPPESQSATCGADICGIKKNNCGTDVNCGDCLNNLTCSNGICVNSSLNCTDYLGEEFWKKDYVYNGSLLWDLCLDSNNLTEYICIGNDYSSINVTCSYGCSDGKCTCTNDAGCSSAGNFCDDLISYNCSLNSTTGCFERTNLSNCDDGIGCTDDSCSSSGCSNNADDSNCGAGFYCDPVKDCVALPGCTSDDNCTLITGPCGNDFCNLTSGKCEIVYNQTTDVCRQSVDECNPAETCEENSALCPSDDFFPDFTSCTNEGVSCTDDYCLSGVCSHFTNDSYCNDEYICNGTETCDSILGCQAGIDELLGTTCGPFHDCPDSGCNNLFYETYLPDAYDTCDGAGDCDQYSCSLTSSLCKIDCNAGCEAGSCLGEQSCNEMSCICEGQECTNHATCVSTYGSNYYCDSSNICQEKINNGERCDLKTVIEGSLNDVCLSGICKADYGTGSYCTDSDKCVHSTNGIAALEYNNGVNAPNCYSGSSERICNSGDWAEGTICSYNYFDYLGICGWSYHNDACISGQCDLNTDGQTNCSPYIALLNNTNCAQSILNNCDETCGADCNENTDCSCSLTTGCYDLDSDGLYNDYVVYPNNGNCLNSCSCNIGTGTGEPCENISVSKDDYINCIPQQCSDCGYFPFRFFCDRTECESIVAGCYFVNLVGPNGCYECNASTTCSDYDGDQASCNTDRCTVGGCEWYAGSCRIKPVCGDDVCEPGENCPSDNVSCTNNICYEPTCNNGCSETDVVAYSQDIGCSSPNFCDGNGNCVECISAGDCDDSLFCTGTESCLLGVCQSGTQINSCNQYTDSGDCSANLCNINLPDGCGWDGNSCGETAPQNCNTSIPDLGTGAAFINFPFAPQTGKATFEFDVIPNDNSMDGLVLISNGPQNWYTEYAITPRFNNTVPGHIDVYNGYTENYTYDTWIEYTQFLTYHFRIEADILNQKFDIFVTPEGQAEQQLADDYGFRTPYTTLDNYAIISSVGSISVCDFEVTTRSFGLVAYYKFEGNADDETGRNNGTVINSAYTSGVNGSAIKHNLTSQFKVSDSDSLDMTNEMTLSAWINVTNFVNYAKIITKPYNETNNTNPYELYSLDLQARVPRFIITDGIVGGEGAEVKNSDYVLNAYQWYHIVGTYNGSVMKLYLNGELINSSQTNINIGVNNQSLFIGGVMFFNDYYIDGLIDEVMIYDRALNASEVQQIYNNQKPPEIIPDYPLFSNFLFSVNNNSEYSVSKNYQFNSTIINTNGTAGIQFNSVNYTLSNISNSFYRTFSNLGAGTYNYYWWAYGNGTSHNFNKTQTYYYTVAKNLSYVLNISGTSPITYGTITNIAVSGCPSQLTCNLYRNGIQITPPDNSVLAAGVYNYIYNTTGNTNYSLKSVSNVLTVNSALECTSNDNCSYLNNECAYGICNASSKCQQLFNDSGTLCSGGACDGGGNCNPVGTEITECGLIESPGYYYMNQNIIQPEDFPCINIYANDVILDCKGHSITLLITPYNAGIVSLSLNTVIKNCAISGVQGGWGIYLSGSSNSLVLDNTLNDNSYGIEIDDSSNTQIINNNMRRNEVAGISILSGINYTLAGNKFCNNTQQDLYCDAPVQTFADNECEINTNCGGTCDPCVLLGGEITECVDITTPNQAYYMNQDIFQPLGTSCIRIYAENVSIDCRGHSITSSTTGIAGILSVAPYTTAKNCNVSGLVDGWGVYLSNSNNSYIFNNTFNNNLRGVQAVSYSSDTQIIENKISSNDIGIGVWDASDIKIINNSIKNNTGYSIYTESTYNTSIEYNEIYKGPLSVGYVAGIVSYYSPYTTIKNCNISGFTSSTTSGWGIYLSDSSNAYIFNNSLYNNFIGGRIKYSSDTQIIGNKINSCGIGIWDSSEDNIKIINNSVINSNDTAIMSHGTYNVSIENNKINSSANTAINADNVSKINILNNIMYDNGIGTLMLFTNDSIIMNNIISGFVPVVDSKLVEGISLLDSYNTIVKNNLITFINGSGLSLSHLINSTIINNTANNNSKSGIELMQSEYNTVINNTALSNNEGGFISDEDSSNNNLTGNKFCSNSLYDSFCESPLSMFMNNKCRDNNGCGGVCLSCTGAGQDKEIYDCTTLIEPNSTYVLVNNLVEYGDQNCINVAAQNITLDCQGHSIMLDPSSCCDYTITGVYSNQNKTTIKNCNIINWDSGRSGIALDGASDSLIFNNSLINDTLGIEETRNSSGIKIINNIIKKGNFGLWFNGYYDGDDLIRAQTKGAVIGTNIIEGFSLAIYMLVIDSNITNNNISFNDNGLWLFPGSLNNNIIGNKLCSNNEEDVLCYDSQASFINNKCEKNSCGGTCLPCVSVCGNDIVETGEECDNANLLGQTCMSLGYSGGNLSCYPFGHASQCQFNTSQCTGTPAGIPVYSCQELNILNSLYVLKADLTLGDSVCIDITANNITLDCQGHSITRSSGPTFNGIYSTKNYTTIKNCVISLGSDSVSRYGIYLDSSDNSKVINNTFTNNSEAIYSWGSNNDEFIDNKIINTVGSGIYFATDVTGNKILNNIIKNASRGLEFTSGSSNNYSVINNNSIENCTNSGIGFSGFYNNITNNRLSSNQDGIRIEGGSHNIIKNNIIENNQDNGVYTYNTASTEFINNTIGRNKQSGLSLEGYGDYDILINNTIYNNSKGVYSYSRSSVIKGNKVYSNSIYGLEIWNAHWSNITGNDFCKNAYDAICWGTSLTNWSSNSCREVGGNCGLNCSKNCSYSGCYEFDNGQDFFIKSTTFTNITRKEDNCTSSKNLSEYYCNGSVINQTNYTCTDMCSNGACTGSVPTLNPWQEIIDFFKNLF